MKLIKSHYREYGSHLFSKVPLKEFMGEYQIWGTSWLTEFTYEIN